MAFEDPFNHDTASTPPRPEVPSTGEGVFDIRVHRPRPDITVVTVAGPLDMASLPHFTDIVHPRVSSTCPALVLDLSGVTFLCANGIDTLLHIQHRAQALGKHLILVTGAHAVDRPLRALGLATRFAYGDPPMTRAGAATEEVAVPAGWHSTIPQRPLQPT